jgi:hypothetical protein
MQNHSLQHTERHVSLWFTKHQYTEDDKNMSLDAYTTRGATKYKPIPLPPFPQKNRGIAEVTPFSTAERSTTRIHSVVNNISPHFKPRIQYTSD